MPLMRSRSALLLLVLSAGCAPNAPAPAPAPAPQAAQAAADPTRFESDIHQFDEANRQRPVPPGGTVFVGSSSIRRWSSLEADFPGIAPLNRGFGGSELSDVLHYLDRVVIRYAPGTVVVYAGENDLNGGKSPERVLADFRTLVRRVHAAHPQTRIGFISVKPSPSRWRLAPQMRATNALVREFTASDPRLFFVNVFDAMLGPDGSPRPELFVEDMLHMNEAGYRIWRAAVAPHL
jgi:lysophospholipase L1-like esterase